VVIKWLQAKTGPGRMALNATNVVIAFGKEYRLHFVPEVFEIQSLSRLLSEPNRGEGKDKSE
jgi:hypothetical protein